MAISSEIGVVRSALYPPHLSKHVGNIPNRRRTEIKVRRPENNTAVINYNVGRIKSQNYVPIHVERYATCLYSSHLFHLMIS